MHDCVKEVESDDAPDVVFFFVSQAFSVVYERIFDALSEHFPSAVLIGSSAGGLVGTGRETEFQPGLSLLCGWLPEVGLHPFHLDEAPDLDGPPDLWRDIVAPGAEDVKGMVLLADPYTFEPDKFLPGLDFAYPHATKVGGLASGCEQPGEAALFCGSEMYRHGCVGLAFSGPIDIKPAVAQGCRPFGKQYTVTECKGSIILELGGRPATDALGEMLESMGPEERRAYLTTAIFLGLGAGMPTLKYQPGDFLVRQVLGADERTGALVVGGRVRKGQTVQFHLRNRETSRQDLKEVLERLAEELEKPAEGALLFSCLGRGRSLYGEPSHDSKVFGEIIGEIPLSGFFCNGEIGPVRGETSVHGFTSSFCIFS